MKTISEIQNQIRLSLSNCCSSIGFDVANNPTFYNHLNINKTVRIIHIDFLNAKSAAFFNSNTASFILNLGIYFNTENQNNLYPKEYEAQIRGTLIKDFRQKNPKDLNGLPLFHPERRRRDIWWVEKDEMKLDGLLANASRIITNNAMKWLDKYSNIEYIISYLKKKNVIDQWKGGPFGFGSIGSPFRQNLIKQLETKTR
jgi:hypothetical protein